MIKMSTMTRTTSKIINRIRNSFRMIQSKNNRYEIIKHYVKVTIKSVQKLCTYIKLIDQAVLENVAYMLTEYILE